MAKHNCENCNFGAIYDNNSKSLLGRLWRGHMTSLPTDEGTTLAEKYDYLSKMFPHKGLDQVINDIRKAGLK